MKKLIDLFIEKTSWVNGITIAITVAGLVALLTMKRDLHPPFKFNYVNVSFTYQYGSPEEIERLITYPIEENLRTIADVEEITSTTKVGRATITLKFPQKIKSLSDKIEEVRNRAQSISAFLPENIRDFSVSQSSDNSVWVASLGVSGIDPYNWDHHHFLEALKNKLLGVPGIVNVGSSLKPYHVFVRFDRDKLAKHGVTVTQIRAAIQNEIQGNSMGYNYANGKEWLLEFKQKGLTPEQLRALPLFKNTLGHGLKLSDVADVTLDMEQNDKYQFLLNGTRAIDMWIMKSFERDTIDTFKDVKTALKEINLPQGVKVEVLYDGPYFIEQQIQVLMSNGFGGLILVLLMLAFAMGWKSSLMTAIGLPISYFGTFLILKFFGISIDLISMIAMILVVGNLVDDAVIFAELYNQKLWEGIAPKDAASQAARELIIPVTGTICTIICAFIPIIVIDSELSIVFFAIPIVVATALALSWFETFFILPNHLQHYATKPSGERAIVFFHFLSRGYMRALRHTLRFRYLYGLGSLALLGFSLWTATKMPQDFSLSINPPEVNIYVTFKEELSFKEVVDTLDPLQKDLLKIPKNDLAFVGTSLGYIERQGKVYRGPKFATISLNLNREETDVRSLRNRVEAKTNQIISAFKDTRIQELVVVASQKGDGGRRKDLASVEIRGRDENLFRLAKNDVLKALEKQGNIGENVPPDNLGPNTFHFIPNNMALRSYQLSRGDLAFQVQAQTSSVELVQTRDGGRWMKIFLEPKNLKEPTVQELASLKIQSPVHGELFPIKNLGSWETAGYSQTIDHKNSVRVLSLDFRYDSKKTNEQIVKQEIAKLIEPLNKKYPGLNIEATDANEEDKKGREWTGKIILAAGILIYLILALTLQSWAQPLIVGLPIPFAVIGVVWALKLHGLPLGLMAMIGLIGTMGVAVNDSIVMVHHINGLARNFGGLNAELIIRGAASRLRAIFLTASCTLVGVFPTAYGIGGESGFTQPLAFSMGWGLSASLLLTLFIIPAMLMVFDDLKDVTKKLVSKIAKRSRSRHASIELTNSEIRHP